MTRNSPYWLARVPKTRRPAWLRHRGELVADVAIVGGGLTGCATAWVFASAGIKTALLEAGQVGQGATAAAPGIVRLEPDIWFGDLERAGGRRAARRVWQMAREAAFDLGSAVRRLGIRCDFTPRDGFLIAARGDAARLEREAAVRRDADREAVWLPPRRVRAELGLEAEGAIKARGWAQLDPYRLCLGFAKAAQSKGACLFERSAVKRIRAGSRNVELTTEAGRVVARTVIVATGEALPLFRPLARHLRVADSYVVLTPPLGRRTRDDLQADAAILEDTAMPPHLLAWTREARILFAGADQPPVNPRSRERVLRQRAGQLMYELSLLYPTISGVPAEHAWMAPLTEAANGLMFAGPHRNYPRHLFALGVGRHGVSFPLLAARILLRRYQETPAPGDDLFGF
jgi:gamma-glutamylputrescine oxidase